MTSNAMSPNHREILSAQSTITNKQEYLLSTSGALLVTGSITPTPPLASLVINNQKTATTSASALPSNVLTQGVIIEALSTNTVSVFVGNASVTTSTGIELPPGSTVTIPVSNTNIIYIVCASSSPVISFVGV